MQKLFMLDTKSCFTYAQSKPVLKYSNWHDIMTRIVDMYSSTQVQIFLQQPLSLF